MRQVFPSVLGLALATAVAFFSSACSPKAAPPASTSPDTPASAEAAGAADSQVAPAWTLKDLTGKSVSLSDFKGKVAVLNFWATWCPPCRAEIPEFIEMQKKYGPLGATVVGISLDSLAPPDVAKFVQDQRINYPIVMADEATATAYGADQAIPITIVVGKNGRVLYQQMGIIDRAAVEDAIEKALKQAS